ncbi:MAG: DUF2093 domain-containing protein [Parasphingorhabdus sp.]|nr:DUF2093 domain-containing protein [Parasphingorhabdus sp.]
MLMSNRNRVARLQYQPNGFRLLTPGDHVICAVSGQPIMLEELRYWSVERQEPYATAQISAVAHRPETSS